MVEELLDALGIEVVPFTPAQARAARAAFRDIGRGSGHPAGLNLGDCFAYTTAQDLGGEALLFTGDHFPPTHTDVRRAC